MTNEQIKARVTHEMVEAGHAGLRGNRGLYVDKDDVRDILEAALRTMQAEPVALTEAYDDPSPLFAAPPAPPSVSIAGEIQLDTAALYEAWKAVSGAGYRHLEPLVADAIRAYLAALSDAPAREGWRSLDTAPSDGSRILTILGNGYIEIRRADGEWWRSGLCSTNIPVGWMPLPAASPTGEDA